MRDDGRRSRFLRHDRAAVSGGVDKTEAKTVKVKWQQVLGGHYDYAELKCDCGRVSRVGVGENNWMEFVNEKGQTLSKSNLPKCYGGYNSANPICRLACYFSHSCLAKKGVGVPHTNEELERIKRTKQ